MFEQVESPSLPKHTRLPETTDAPHGDVIDEDDAVIVIEKKTKSANKLRVLAALFVLVLVLAGCAAVYLFVIFPADGASDNSATNVNDLQSYVLPNATVTVIEATDTSISGEFTADDVAYEFSSFSDSISFRKTETADNVLEGMWSGFTLSVDEDTSVLTMSIFALNGTVYAAEFAGNTTAEPAMLSEFMADPLIEHFVEMTVKLASNGYIGSQGQHLAALYGFAQWIWKYEETQSFWNHGEYDVLSEEFEKLNAIVDASNRAGHWITDMNELLTYTSNATTINQLSVGRTGRHLLGSCGDPSEICDNECFGRCGPNCWCWSWKCGDCGCWDGCYNHDYYCSCISLFHPFCINVLWVGC